MSLKENIKKLEEHLILKGKTDTWNNLANQFSVFQDKKGEAKGDSVRSIYRRLNRNGQLNIQPNLKLKSRWQSANGEWLESYKASEEVDVKEVLSDFKSDFLNDIKNINKSFKLDGYKKSSEDAVLYEIAMPDFHFGKISGMSILEQSNLFFKTIVSLVEKTEGLNIERFLLPLGNDFFNTDNLNYTTTKGTSQQDNCSWQESFRIGWKTVLASVNFLLKYAPVDIVIVQGNHDYERSFYLGDLLTAYYHDNHYVRIDNGIDAPRKYYVYNDILLGFTHGDKEKVSELPLLMATEVPELWALSKHREFHTGHLHKQETTEIQTVLIRTLPALCGTDSWHKQMGYNSIRKAQGYVWGKEGLEGYFQKSY